MTDTIIMITIIYAIMGLLSLLMSLLAPTFFMDSCKPLYRNMMINDNEPRYQILDLAPITIVLWPLTTALLIVHFFNTRIAPLCSHLWP